MSKQGQVFAVAQNMYVQRNTMYMSLTSNTTSNSKLNFNAICQVKGLNAPAFKVQTHKINIGSTQHHTSGLQGS